jgi:T5SS/PEP-CTERM-associated repeat protein
MQRYSIVSVHLLGLAAVTILCVGRKYHRWLWSLVVVFGTMQSAAYGTDFTWNAAGGGIFETAGNWSPAGGPPNNGTDTALFDLASAYEVVFDGHVTNNDFEVTTGDVTFDMFRNNQGSFNDRGWIYTLDATSGGGAHIGSAPGAFFAAKLTLNGDVGSNGRSTVATSSFLHLGRDAFSGGILELNGVDWESTQITYVGLNGSGVLTVNGFSEMTNTLGIMGFGAGSFGTATINGRWTNTDTLSVGIQGTADLTINGTVSNDGDGQIAAGGGSMGTVVVDTAVWDNNASLWVGGTSGGAGGTGELTMQGFGTITAVNVANDMGVRTNGTVTIGNGTLDVGGQLTLDAGSILDLVDGNINAGTLTGAADTMTWTTGDVNITAGDFAIDVDTPLGANETLNGGQSLSVSGTFQVGPTAAGSVIALNGATITSTDGTIGSNNPAVFFASVILSDAGTDWTMTGDLTVGTTGGSAAQLTIGQDAVVSNRDAFIADNVGAAAVIDMTSSGATWNNSGSMYLGGNATTLGGTGTLDVDSGDAVNVGTTLKVWDNFVMTVNGGTITTPTLEVLGTVNYVGTLDLSGIGDIGSLVLVGGTVSADAIDFADQSFAGFGSLDGVVSVGGDVTATGNLTMGDASSFAGVQIGGGLDVSTHIVTIKNKGFFSIGSSTIIAGGTLVASGGVLVAGSNGLSAFGTIDGRVVAQSGSTIEATGSLTLGDATSPAGLFSDGEMSVGDNTVTLLDANEAVLGSLTTLGNASLSGTLVAANGAVLEFGKNIEGFGTVNTPDDPFKPLINNGSIAGNSALEPITLTGYIKGVGTLDNVVITGTDAPGFSPATVYRGSVTYDGTLDIEIGGLTPGSFDIIYHSGTATLGGTLDLSLINGFAPGLGDTFQFLTAASRVGEFASVLGTDLGGNLAFDVLYGVTDVTLQVISTALVGDLDGDGFVGINDLNLVLGNWNQNVPPGDPLADPSGDGFVGIADLNVVLGNWNAGTPTGEVAIPEPGTLMLLSLGAIALIPGVVQTGRHGSIDRPLFHAGNRTGTSF